MLITTICFLTKLDRWCSFCDTSDEKRHRLWTVNLKLLGEKVAQISQVVERPLFCAVACCYYQTDDCNHNHKHLIVTHEHHLPISTFEESERNPPRYPIMNIWEVEPSTVSRQCQFHYHIYIATYQEFSTGVWLRVFSTLSTDATPATSTTTSTLATNITTATESLQIQPHSPSSPSLQNTDNFQEKEPKQFVLVRVVREY